jgi:hypothetical protein
MTAAVPTLEGTLLITDPEWIIAYQWKRYARQPAKTIPILADLIPSLPEQISKFGKQPDILARNIQGDMQSVLGRIFSDDRNINVTATATSTGETSCLISVNFTYTLLNGEASQTVTSIALNPQTGRLTLPIDTLPDAFYNKA